MIPWRISSYATIGFVIYSLLFRVHVHQGAF